MTFFFDVFRMEEDIKDDRVPPTIWSQNESLSVRMYNRHLKKVTNLILMRIVN